MINRLEPTSKEDLREVARIATRAIIAAVQDPQAVGIVTIEMMSYDGDHKADVRISLPGARVRLEVSLD